MPADIFSVRDRWEETLMVLPHVVGVAIGERVRGGETRSGEMVIKVFVQKKLPESQLQQEEIIPKQVEGYPTDVEESGTLKAWGKAAP